VFFGGAGVSTESGIPDFRSTNGLYHEKAAVSPEEIVSHDFFFRYPSAFYDFYRAKMIYPSAKPNAAHLALAKLEAMGHLAAVVTQNIDSLHQSAGNKKVFELHGSVHRNFCTKCGKPAALQEILEAPNLPTCRHCGSLLKPDVVLYGEALDEDTVSGALEAIEQADLLLIGGTSLSVWPAAGFIRSFHGELGAVIINKSPTPGDALCDLCISDNIGKVFDEVMRLYPTV